MAHTKPENLADLAAELQSIRQLDGLKEKSPGIFYRKSAPFLHFHDSEGDRWADVKRDGEWIKVSIPFKATKKERKRFLDVVRKAFRDSR